MLPLSYNLRNLVVRRTTTLLAAGGIALVTAIFAAVLALAEGFRTSQVAMGDPGVAVVLRPGSTSAINSIVFKDQARLLATLPEVRDEATSPELLVIFQLETTADSGSANVLVRGVTPEALLVHPEVRIAAGRMFDPSRNEVIVGRSAASRYRGMTLGSRFRQSGAEWEVVGIFGAAGSGFESEIWTGADRAMEAFDRNEYSLVSLRLDDTTRIGTLAARIREDLRLQLLAQNEVDYYAAQATTMTGFLQGLGIFVTSILAVGAVFGAINTMYASVGARVGEIATLRALGFRRRDILLGLMVEAALIGLAGGVLGVLITLPVNGISSAVMNWQSFSDVAFKFRLTPSIALYSVAWAVAMGAIGGIFPAIRAVRLPVAAAFRDVA